MCIEVVKYITPGDERIISPAEMEYDTAYQLLRAQGDHESFYIFLNHGEKDSYNWTQVLEIEMCCDNVDSINTTALHVEDDLLVPSYREIDIRIYGKGR